MNFSYFLPSLTGIHGSERIVLGDILEFEILIALHVLNPPESKNYIFSGLFVCAYIYVVSAIQK